MNISLNYHYNNNNMEYYIIKHCDKADGDHPGNHCSPSGFERSQKLVDLFNRLLDKRYPTHLIVPSNLDPPCKKSDRMIETLTPLAKHYGIIIEQKYCADDIDNLVRYLTSITVGPVIICWQHAEMISIIKKLINKNNPPNLAPYDNTRNDLIYRLTMKENSCHLEVILQNLMPYDHNYLPIGYQVFEVFNKVEFINS